MGIYVNPGNELMQDALNSMIYVDKSLIVRELNNLIGTRQKYVCVSRPRRFGKSMAKALLMAYYSRGCKSHRQFKNLKIAQEPSYRKYLNKLNVIAIDCVDFSSNLLQTGKDSFVNRMTERVKRDFIREFQDIDFSDCQSIAECIQIVYQETGVKFVILIDEYDLPIRIEQPESLFQEYLALLLSLFKSEATGQATALAYITGILPIVRDKVESKLNNFREYTFLEPAIFAEFTGFTEQEVQELCDKYNVNYQECLNWYDGYNVEGINICNPHAIVESITFKKFKPFWSNTGTYETIAPYIKGNYKGIKDDLITMLSGGSVPVNITSFANTLSDIT
ncbi:MAG: AAA family ATPase, partial [Bacteroidales bacterium]|nr:AAA family ATPase [Bacteroidales bacterium]